MLGVLSLLPDLERYYKFSIPHSIVAAIRFTGTTKKSHAYVTVIDGLIILDHEDPIRASTTPLPESFAGTTLGQRTTARRGFNTQGPCRGKALSRRIEDTRLRTT
ncbi:unnamed protein product [Withania somnifera]